MRHLALALALLLLPSPPALAQEAAPLVPPAEEWHTVLEAVTATNTQAGAAALDPLAAPLIACSGTACRHQWLVVLDADDRADIRAEFAATDTPEQERRAVARAIARIETSVGHQNGTWADAAGNHPTDTDDPDQLDCVSETINTRSYLQRLAQAGLLAHHHLGRVAIRFTLILQHVAGTIVDDSDDAEYVIDSWVGANGEEPSVENYSDWRSHWAV